MNSFLGDSGMEDQDRDELSTLRPDAPEWLSQPQLCQTMDPLDELSLVMSLSGVTSPSESAKSSPLRTYRPNFLMHTPPRRDLLPQPFLGSPGPVGSPSTRTQDARLFPYASPSPTTTAHLHSAASSRFFRSPDSEETSAFRSPYRAPSTPHANSIHSFSGLDSSEYVYIVQFKRSYRNYSLSVFGPKEIVKGDFVIVEADRGEDLGVVREKVHMALYEEEKHTAGHRGRGFAMTTAISDMRSILRIATPAELALIPDKVIEEELTLQVCREKAAERGLPMTIIDAEYQFDRHKLTFYFESVRRIDFRDLVSDMFALYKTRIWMAQIDMASASRDFGEALAMQAGFLPHPSERYPDPAVLASFSSPTNNMLRQSSPMLRGLGGPLHFSRSSSLDHYEQKTTIDYNHVGLEENDFASLASVDASLFDDKLDTPWDFQNRNI